MRRLLAPLSWIYGAAVHVRNRRFDRERPRQLPVPVISVGNLTVGGSGKTPLVAALSRELLSRGHRVAVVSRGYRRSSSEPYVLVSDGKRLLATAHEGGDEPVELARAVPGLAVAVGPDRYDVGARLIEEIGEHVIVLDDGFQHRALARQLDLVCFDCSEPRSSWRLLPAGRLREPLANVSRADAVVLTGWRNGVPPEIASGTRLLRADVRVVDYVRVDAEEERLRADAFHDVPVVLAAGVARPERIENGLDATVVHFASRGDHHRWRSDEVRSLMDKGERLGAEALLVTGKDAVKMDGMSGSLPIYRIGIETEILEADALRELLVFPAS